MIRRRRMAATTAVIAAIIAGTTTACTDDSGDPNGDPTTPVTSSPTRTLSPEQQTRENAKSDATDALEQYFKTLDELGQDPKAPIAKLKAVAISTELLRLEARFQRWRRDGWRQVGEVQVVDRRADSVSLDNSDPDAGRVPTVTVVVCTDVSDVDVVDRTGSSVVKEGRPDELTTRYWVANYTFADDKRTGWKITGAKDIKEGPCAA